MIPKYVEIDGTRFAINTNFRIALECEKIANDATINDYERSLAIIYKLFGEKGLEFPEMYENLLELAVKYLRCGNEGEPQPNSDEISIDIIQDMDYIKASFMSDYGIDLDEKDLHFWQFSNLLNGLTENAIINRVRYVREFDLSQVKDPKEREKWIKQKDMVALKKQNVAITDEQRKSKEKFMELIGMQKGGK